MIEDTRVVSEANVAYVAKKYYLSDETGDSTKVSNLHTVKRLFEYDPFYSDYTKLDYLESQGNQYILTDITPNQDTRIICNATMIDVQETAYGPSGGVGGVLYGSGIAVGNTAFEFYTSRNRYEVNYGNNANYFSNKNAIQNENITIDQNMNVATITRGDGSTETITNDKTNFTTPYTLAIFALHRERIDYKGVTRIHYLDIYSYGVIRNTFVPAKRNSDNELGLYDTLNNEFYTNSGTGSFIAGPEIPYMDKPDSHLVSVGNLKDILGKELGPFDSEYTRLEYIQSQSSLQQYIDLGIKFTGVDRISSMFQFINDGATWYSLFAARDSEYTGGNASCLYGEGYNHYVSYYYGNSSGNSGAFSSTFFNKHTFRATQHICYLDSIIINAGSYAQTFENTINVVLFASHDGNKIQTFSSVRLYNFEVTRGNDQWFWVPAKRKSDGVVGLYEVHHGVFYGNSGSGNFIAGPELLNPYTNYTPIEYVESSGAQYFDTKIFPNTNTKVRMDVKLLSFNYWHNFFGERGASPHYLNEFALWVNQTGQYRMNYVDDAGVTFGTVTFDRKIIELNSNVTKFNSMVVAEDNTEELIGDLHIWLLQCNEGGSPTFPMAARVYRCQIFAGTVILRDLRPVKRKSDNVVGLIDLVTHDFLTNQGTGTFVAGPEL